MDEPTSATAGSAMTMSSARACNVLICENEVSALASVDRDDQTGIVIRQVAFRKYAVEVNCQDDRRNEDREHDKLEAKRDPECEGISPHDEAKGALEIGDRPDISSRRRRF